MKNIDMTGGQSYAYYHRRKTSSSSIFSSQQNDTHGYDSIGISGIIQPFYIIISTMICYILDDQYGKKIYEGLHHRHDIIFPIQENILNPLEYIDDIVNTQPDYILLDNYFPNRGSGREESLGAEFLEKIHHYPLRSKIICISDYGKRLLNQYDERQESYDHGQTIDFIPSKDPAKISILLQ